MHIYQHKHKSNIMGAQDQFNKVKRQLPPLETASSTFWNTENTLHTNIKSRRWNTVRLRFQKEGDESMDQGTGKNKKWTKKIFVCNRERILLPLEQKAPEYGNLGFHYVTYCVSIVDDFCWNSRKTSSLLFQWIDRMSLQQLKISSKFACRNDINHDPYSEFRERCFLK